MLLGENHVIEGVLPDAITLGLMGWSRQIIRTIVGFLEPLPANSHAQTIRYHLPGR